LIVFFLHWNSCMIATPNVALHVIVKRRVFVCITQNNLMKFHSCVFFLFQSLYKRVLSEQARVCLSQSIQNILACLLPPQNSLWWIWGMCMYNLLNIVNVIYSQNTYKYIDMKYIVFSGYWTYIGEYWHELALKMHDLVSTFLQPISANIHQFNNPFII
jgi:hypothetical protein